MRRRVWGATVAAWLRLGSGLALGLVVGVAHAVLFERSVDDLQREIRAAGAEGKQLAVVLSLPDCPGCLEMEKTVYRDTHTQRAIERRFRTVHLDLARSEPITDSKGRATTAVDLAKGLRAFGTPSFVFFAADGSLLYRYSGTLDRAGLRRLADYVVRAKYETVPFASRDATRGKAADRPSATLHASPPAGNLPLYPELALSASDGRERRLADFRGQVVALSVGYTQCPDVCPTTLLVLKGAVEALPLVQRQRVQVLFATLDPDRDALAMLKEYVAAFSPAGGRPVVGLRGNAEATARLISQLQLVAEKRPSGNAGYTLDHTAGVFLFDGGGRLRGVAPFGQSAADLRSDLASLLAEGAGGQTVAQRFSRAY